MKKRIVPILLTLGICVVSLGMEAITSIGPKKYIENVEMEESLEPTWGEINKNAPIFTEEAIAQYRAIFGDNSDIETIYENYMKSESEKTVKSVKGDGQGNAIITYTNGTKETIQVFDKSYVDNMVTAAVANIKPASTPSSPVVSNSNSNSHLEKKIGSLPRVIANFAPDISVELLDVDVQLIKNDTLDPDPSMKYVYAGYVKYLVHNSTTMPTHYKAKITLDNSYDVTMTSSSENAYNGDLYVEKRFSFNTATPIYKAITDVSIYYE